mgnify:CR=1 FL=1
MLLPSRSVCGCRCSVLCILAVVIFAKTMSTQGIVEAHALGKRFFLASNVAPHNNKVRTYLADLEPIVAMGQFEHEAVAFDPLVPETVFIGNDVGVFATRDAGMTWEAFTAGLPNDPARMGVFSVRYDLGRSWGVKATSGESSSRETFDQHSGAGSEPSRAFTSPASVAASASVIPSAASSSGWKRSMP